MKVKKNTLSMSHYHTITVTEYVYILKFINNLKRIKFIKCRYNISRQEYTSSNRTKDSFSETLTPNF